MPVDWATPYHFKNKILPGDLRRAHDFLVGQLVGAGAETRGFLSKIDKAMRSNDCWDGFGEYRPKLIPDAFFILLRDGDAQLNEIHVYEVEDTSALSRDKLRQYAELWFDIDGTDSWHLRLFRADRAGETHEISLITLWYQNLANDHYEAEKFDPAGLFCPTNP